jgi:GNAT superfamily N-acetyltransferase
MDNYRIEQVKVDNASLKETQQLLQLVFEEHADKFSFEYLKWQYAENPVGPIVGFNAYMDDELAAHYVTMPIYMSIEGRKTLGVLSLNTATHPNHRGKRLFSILAEKTYQFAADNGYKFVIGVANANSTHGFLKNLNFKLIGPLTFKIGVGTNVYPQRDYTFTRYWDKEILEWRLKNPSMRYYKNGNLIVSPIKVGFKKLVCHNGADLVSLPKLHLRPLNLYIGYGADLNKGIYMNLPKFIERSPFNLIFRDLTNGTLPEVTKENILFELIDFDVA